MRPSPRAASSSARCMCRRSSSVTALCACSGAGAAEGPEGQRPCNRRCVRGPRLEGAGGPPGSGGCWHQAAASSSLRGRAADVKAARPCAPFRAGKKARRPAPAEAGVPPPGALAALHPPALCEPPAPSDRTAFAAQPLQRRWGRPGAPNKGRLWPALISSDMCPSTLLDSTTLQPLCVGFFLLAFELGKIFGPLWFPANLSA